jgi:hypothetical protein
VVAACKGGWIRVLNIDSGELLAEFQVFTIQHGLQQTKQAEEEEEFVGLSEVDG